MLGSNANVYGILVIGNDSQVLNNDVITTMKQGSGTAWGIAVGGGVAGSSNGFVVNNRITEADVGVEFIHSTGKYRDNLTFTVTTPFDGTGTPIGIND
jgi:hypothetical protein